ncbi:MAG: helix-turn-helix domain-containing protein [Halolamina sp.]
MSVIADFSLPATDFILGKALHRTTGLTLKLEKMIPTGNATIPYFWVTGDRTEGFDAILEGEPEVADFEVIDEVDDRKLYRAEWDASTDSFVQTMIAHDGALQEADGDGQTWEFQIRFRDSHQLSSFHTTCGERGIDLTVKGLYNPIEPMTAGMQNMTDGQRDIIEHAYDAGYFEVPRQITLAEIAADVGVSDQAVNERLRRGLRTLIATTLKSGSD